MVFDYLRPILILLLTFSTILFFVLLLRKGGFKTVNRLYVISMSFICVTVATIVTWQVGIITDELGLGGDAVGSILFLAIFSLSIINIVLYFVKGNRPKKRRY